MGYLYSEYHLEKYPKNIEIDKLPFAVYLDDLDELRVIGSSEYNKGLLKTAMLEQGNTLFVQFLSKGPTWHCFYSASKGLQGKEPGNQKHIHYLSNKVGIPRDMVKNAILSCSYKGKKAHVNNYSEDEPAYIRMN